MPGRQQPPGVDGGTIDGLGSRFQSGRIRDVARDDEFGEQDEVGTPGKRLLRHLDSASPIEIGLKGDTRDLSDSKPDGHGLESRMAPAARSMT